MIIQCLSGCLCACMYALFIAVSLQCDGCACLSGNTQCVAAHTQQLLTSQMWYSTCSTEEIQSLYKVHCTKEANTMHQAAKTALQQRWLIHPWRNSGCREQASDRQVDGPRMFPCEGDSTFLSNCKTSSISESNTLPKYAATLRMSLL